MEQNYKEITHKQFGTYHLKEDVNQVVIEDYSEEVLRRMNGKRSQTVKNRATVEAAQHAGILVEQVIDEESIKSIHPAKVVWLALEIVKVIAAAYEYPDEEEAKN